VKRGKIESSGINDALLREVTEVFSRIQGVKEVTFTQTHSKPTPLVKDLKEGLVVNLWSVPSTVKDPGSLHESLYEKGISIVKGRKIGLTPWQGDVYDFKKKVPKGFTVIKDLNKRGLALYKDNNIWILFDIADSRDHKLAEIEDVLTYIINQAGFEIRPWDLEDEKEHLQKLYGQFLKRQVDQLKQKADKTKRDFEAAERTYLQRLSNMISEDRMVGATLDKLADMKGSTEDMWNKIVEVKEIKKINLVNLDQLECLTHDIMMGPFNIGSFKITLANTGLRIRSNIVKSGHQHPHVSGEGVPCLGNAGDLMKHFYSGEWDVTLLTLIKFLKSYNGASPHTRIDEFLKKISKEEAQKYKDLLVEKKKTGIRRILSTGQVKFS